MSSSKRRATSDLNSDNWDKEDSDPEEPGEFAKVDQVQLSQRIVKKAKRSLNSSSDSGSKASPFSGFKGFTNKPSSGALFSFGAGSSTAAPAIPATSTPATSTPATSTLATSTPASITTSTRPKDYFHSLARLNEAVLKWLQEHFDKHAYCDFTPVFKDYAEHLKKLDKEYPLTTSSSSDKPSKVTHSSTDKSSQQETESSKEAEDKLEPAVSKGGTNGFGSIFKMPPTSKPPPLFPSSLPTTTTSSGTAATTTTTTSSTFLSSAVTPPTFSFITQPAVTPTVVPLSAEATKSFSFGTAPLSKPSSGEGGDAEKEEDYSPPEPEKGFVEEDALYTVRCKLFFKGKNGMYVDRGVGNLVILKQEDGKSQLVVRMATALGNPLLNIRLSSNLPMQRLGSNNVVVMCVPNPPFEGITTPITTLLRVKSPAEADHLLGHLNKYKN